MNESVDKDYIKLAEYLSEKVRQTTMTGYFDGNVTPCRKPKEGIIERLIKTFNLKVD